MENGRTILPTATPQLEWRPFAPHSMPEAEREIIVLAPSEDEIDVWGLCSWGHAFVGKCFENGFGLVFCDRAGNAQASKAWHADAQSGFWTYAEDLYAHVMQSGIRFENDRIVFEGPNVNGAARCIVQETEA